MTLVTYRPLLTLTVLLLTLTVKRSLSLFDVSRDDGWVGGWRGDAVGFRFQSPPVEACVRFSRTPASRRPSPAVFDFSRQARWGLGATTMPLRLIRPRLSPEQ